MPLLASDTQIHGELDASAISVLTQACHTVFNEAVRLETRLERPEEVHIAQIRGRVNGIFEQLDQQFSEDIGTMDVWHLVRQVLRDLIEHIIINSSWAAGLACSHCKANLNLSRLPPGTIEEVARSLDEPYQASAMLIMLALRNREPHALYNGHWGQLARDVLSSSQPTISEKDFPNAFPSPPLPSPLVQKPLNIEPLNSKVTPVGLAGEAWNDMEAFYQEHRITWKGLPLNLLLGETGCGKTELVRASDLPFAPINGEPRKNQNLTWWYAAKKGVVLEIPGGFTSENATESENAQWTHILELLSTRSPTPIDSLTLAVNLSVILEGETRADELAERLRAMLQQVSRSLGVRFPVYLIFTHCETLFGFTEFANNLHPHQYQTSLAWVPTTPLTTSLEPDTAREGIAQLASHFLDLMPHLLIQASDRMEAGRIYAFPQEFEQLQEPLANFLQRLFTAYGSKPLFFFRGAWFTSAKPSGQPIQRAFAFTPPAEETQKALPAQRAETPLFCGDVFENRIFAEKNLVQMGPREMTGAPTARSGRIKNLLSHGPKVFQSLSGWKRDIVFLILLVLFVWVAIEAYRLVRVLEVTRILKHEPQLVLNFKLLPAGEFIMGSPSSDLYRDDDETPHWREIKTPFYMAEFEVTQGQWFEVMGYNPSFYKDPDYPVDSVSWLDCKEFIDKLNHRTREGRYALPSEKQWEYAARAGSQESLPKNAENRAWFAVNSMQRTHPTGFKEPDDWGLYDMFGNVSEWVQDWYHPDYLPIQDPNLPRDGTKKVRRGGAFFDQIQTLRPSRRIAGEPGEVLPWVGFRLVWIPNPQSKTGQYLANHPKRISVFFIARDWARNNGALLSSLAGDMGGWFSDNWDALWGLISGGNSEATPQEAGATPAAAPDETNKKQ